MLEAKVERVIACVEDRNIDSVSDVFSLIEENETQLFELSTKVVNESPENLSQKDIDNKNLRNHSVITRYVYECGLS